MKASLILPYLATLATAAVSPDIADDLPFKMGLLPRQSVNNLQVFTGALGGAAAPAITPSEDVKQPFEVNGDKFVSSPSFLCLDNPPCFEEEEGQAGEG